MNPAHIAERESVAFWLRRDLRFEDNHGLVNALRSGLPVVVVFIFDSAILTRLPKSDARVGYIHRRIDELAAQLESRGATLHVRSGDPVQIWRDILAQGKVRAVYCNEDYEPYARARDEAVREHAAAFGAKFLSFKDQVLFGKNDVVKDDQTPYRVFTAFARKWRGQLKPEDLQPFASENHLDGLLAQSPRPRPSLAALGFAPSGQRIPPLRVAKNLFKNYALTRDLLAAEGTSRLGLHLRFGRISVRKLVAVAKEFSETYLGELIWREFFMQILHHFPLTVAAPFDARYAAIPWLNNPQHFQRWCVGETGYPVVDAGMRELNETGFMHNRARMITASFLTKHLLIDWRWGERYFAEKLLDFELAANVGNWQWAAGCGCDAAPYFRVFNPTLQQQKFDPHNAYVKKWIAEFGSAAYPQPIIDHEMARRRAIATYRKALGVLK